MHVFWPDKFYNVEMFWQPEGAFQGYYVNLALPFEREVASLSYTDLELDISWYTGEEIKLLAIGNVVAFVVALLAIKFFIDFLKKHGFRVWGIYRVILGIILLIMIYTGHVAP